MSGGVGGPADGGGWAERAYAAALLAYPRSFRRRFGAQMSEAFRDQCRAAKADGRAAFARTAIRGLVEVVVSGCVERIAGRGRTSGVQPFEVARRGGSFDRWVSGVRQGARRLLRAPAFTGVTVLSVAFGAGAFASILSVVEGALLEEPPYRDPEGLVWVWRNYTWFDFPRGWLGGPDIAMLRERTETFEAVVGFDADEATLTDMGGGGPEQVGVIAASEEFFDVVGVAPLLGRGFTRGESSVDAEAVVVLGYDLWQRRFGGDPGIVGAQIRLFGDPQRVIGVMPRGFRFVMHASLNDPVSADLYANLQGDMAGFPVNSGRFAGLARVRPGAEGRVAATLEAVSRRLDEESFRSRGLKLWGVGLEEDMRTATRPALVALLGAGVFLLLCLAANLATLLVARAADRAREVAVRSALGAGRLGSVLDLVCESLLVCIAGCVIGLLIAPYLLRALLTLAPPSLPRIEAIDVDLTVVLVTIGTCVVLGFGAALGPALRVAGRDAMVGLRAAGPRAGGRHDASRTRAVLVTVQVALSLMLLVGAALIGRSTAALLRVDPGYRTEGVLTLRVPLYGAAYGERDDVARYHETLRERFAALPGVTGVGGVNAIPLASATNQTSIIFPAAPGNTGDAEADRPLIDWFVATSGYIETMDIDVIEGRTFDGRDAEGSAPVALIDETLARRFFPASSAVGHKLVMNGDTLTVAGVVRHARFYNVFDDDRGEVYLSHAQLPFQAMFYALRTIGNPEALARGTREAVRSLDPAITVADLRSLENIVRLSLGKHRLSLFLLTAFALGSLVLATLGIYGIIAHSVNRRTHEFGVRLALGADRSGIVGLVMREGFRVIGVGVVAGVIGGLLASRVLATLLYGMRAEDPLTFAGVTGFLALVALIACAIPAWRATRVPPAEALRAD